MNPESDNQVCVFLWALPRSVSTAMTKCMSFVDGAEVWHEPYLYCLNNQKYRDPTVLAKLAPEEIRDKFSNSLEQMLTAIYAAPPGNGMCNDDLFEFPWVKTQLETPNPDKKLIFVKDMAYALHDKYEHLPTAKKYRHTFLIRDPRRLYPSLRRMKQLHIPNDCSTPTVDAIDNDPFSEVDQLYKHSYDLWKYTKENLDPDVFIIDGTELATHPEKLLPNYFEALGIPFKEYYLQWDPSTDVTRKWKASLEQLGVSLLMNFQKTAVESGHYIAAAKDPPSRDSLTPDVIRCIDAALPLYQEMYQLRIKP